MNNITGGALRKFRLSKFFWIGVGIFAIGCGPLLMVVLIASLGFGDPNPNPVGFGMLAFFAFWPSLILMVAGLIVSLIKWRSKPEAPYDLSRC